MSNDNQQESVARMLCAQHGGNPDALASEPHDCWEGPLWTAFTNDADGIATLYASRIEVLTEALREIVERDKTAYTAAAADMAKIARNALRTVPQ